MCGRCIDVLPSNMSRETRFPSFFSSPPLHDFTVQSIPVNTDTEGTIESVRIKRVEFRENVRAFPRDKENCLT